MVNPEWITAYSTAAGATTGAISVYFGLLKLSERRKKALPVVEIERDRIIPPEADVWGFNLFVFNVLNETIEVVEIRPLRPKDVKLALQRLSPGANPYGPGEFSERGVKPNLFIRRGAEFEIPFYADFSSASSASSDSFVLEVEVTITKRSVSNRYTRIRAQVSSI